MRFNENDTVRLNFFFRVTSIRGCPTFRGATLSRVAVFRENERANFCREITLHAFLTSRGKAYIYIYIFFFLVKDATTFIRVLFSYVTSYLHQTTGIFLFSPLCPEKRFSTVERAGKFRARCFVCISPSFTGFFLLANATRDCLTPFQTRIFEPAPHDRPLLYLSHSLESRDATLIHFFFESFLAAYAFHSRPTARACLSFTNYFNSFDFANASVFLRFSTGKREGREGREKKKERGSARFEYADRHNPNHAVARKLPFQRSKRFLFSIVSTTNAFRPFLHFHLEGSRRDSKCAISHFY